MELTISELGSLGEFVSSVGVVVTLIYLAVQIRQTKKGLRDNTAALLGASEVNGNEKAVDLAKTLYQDEALSKIVIGGAGDPDNLEDRSDRLRFEQFCHAAAQVHQITFMQWKRGLLDDEYWSFCIRYQGKYFYALPGVQIWWKTHRSTYTPDYRELIDHVIENEGWNESTASLLQFRDKRNVIL
jgi:hypothetical protein